MTIRLQLMIEQKLVREGLFCLLQDEQKINILSSVKCGNGCRQACFQSKCDIIVMGTNSGGFGSLDCMRQVLSRHAGARILLIIGKEQLSLTNEAFRIGAKGVVSMDVPSSMLRKAIQIIVEGGIFIEPWLAQMISEKPFNHYGNPFDVLSSREKTVLQMMLEGRNCSEIVAKLNISGKTVANHHTHIMKKLAVKNLVELTRLAIRHDLIEA